MAITDIDGIQRGKYMHKDKFLSAAESGFGFCDVVFGWDMHDELYDQPSFTGWHRGYPDAPAQVDLSTFRKVPWNDDVPFFLADFGETKEGGDVPVCPRRLLKRTIAKARGMGYEPQYGMEFEWFNFQETPGSLAEKDHVAPSPITPGMFGYSIVRSSQTQSYFMALMDELLAFGVPIEGLHTETGPGVYEAAILYSDALEAADRAVLFKTGVKEIAGRFGIMPTFMARWNTQLPGSSGHIHQSLKEISGGGNAFFDESDTNKMSQTFKHFLAGQMKALPEILPFFAPTVNSYKRLVEGFWAPTRVVWGLDNRTAPFRVIPGGSKSTRTETRVPGADVNPYMAIAAALAAGLYGIENKLELEEPYVGNAYEAPDAVRLSANLQEATEKMNDSKLARELMGDAFIDHFVLTRRWEWKQFESAVTSWEMRRYFEII